MTRADDLLVQQGLAPTRSAAQRLIRRGAVRWLSPSGWAAPAKAGDDLPPGCRMEVADDAELRYVSRGGLKLEAALDHTGLAVLGRADELIQSSEYLRQRALAWRISSTWR